MIVESNYISILTKQLPAHWDSYRIGSVFVERIEKVSDEDFAPLSVTMKGVVPQLENVAKTTNGENRKRVCINDFVINSRSDRKGSGGMSKYDGSVSLINTVLKPNSKYDNRYTNYLLTNVLFQEEFYKFGKGIVDDMWSTKYFDMKYIKVPCPPKEEQIAIANYLDKQAKKIKHFIRKKQAFIELLKEQRQAIISKAVTKGINPDVALKESGIEWLGNIPEHWGLRKLKFCVSLNSNPTPTDTEGKEYLKVALENIDNWTGKFIKTENPDFEGQGNFFKEEDVLFNKLRPYLAKAYVAKEEGFSVGELLVLTPNKEYFTSEFLFQRFMTSDFIEVVNSSTYGAKMPRASWSFIGNLKLPIPPKEEQAQIVSQIKTETAKIDQAIAKAEKEIELIKEYREAMIAEAVLGKLKVSEL
ncbi:restriction endonuclease subunit S [Sinomicrobium oceani]|uniref:restriction endonuclease subunit S n=1 Tax=Sinomicrobium oceani TaxID=1150368 RepID=UPI00227B2AF2|nr:restriction endonuclease subunit S [Sinomicrobium oceani]